MKQQKNLYVLAGVLALFAIVFVVKKRKTDLPSPVAPVSSLAPSTNVGKSQAPDQHINPQFYIDQYNQAVENSSAHQTGFFESAYNEVASFLGFKKETTVVNGESGASQPNNPSSGDGKSNKGGNGTGGGIGIASSGAGGGDSSGGGNSSNNNKQQPGQNGAGKKDPDGTKQDQSGGSSGLVSTGTSSAPQDPIKAASDAAQAAFKGVTHLTVNLPGELTYRNLDLDDGIAGLSGYNTQLQVNISLLAKAGNYGPSDLPAFMQDYGAFIPGYNTAYTDRISKDSPERPAAQSGSGLNSPYVWSIQDGKNTITVALVQRQDGQGTYLAVLSGPTSYFDSNEDRYDSIYSTIRATP